MNDQKRIREQVAGAYARAAASDGERGCCGPTVQKGVAAQLAGYAAAELDELPSDAVANSFGCGNPVAFMEVREGETVLDLGCGAGIDLLLAARRTGPNGKVIGVDMTDEMIARARANIDASGAGNVEVRRGIIEKLPVEDGSVDWVISNCVINLSPDKPGVFQEIARVLRPGGRVSISDIVADDLPAWIREEAAFRSCCVAGAISERDYRDGLRAAGLEDVRVGDRLDYDAADLQRIIWSDLPDGPDEATIARAAQELAGKVASVRFHARKTGP